MSQLAAPRTRDFDTVTLPDLLTMDLDAADFGVVLMDRDNQVVFYNRAESQAAGLPVEQVVGRRFFRDVAPCMNNAMVAGVFAQSGPVDHTLDYVLTLRMRMQPVRLRLLAAPGVDRRALLVDWV